MNIVKQEENSLQRAILYCNERFPPVSYTILVGLFFWSAMIVYSLKPSLKEAWLGGIVMWLVFFHLRIFDEHKDYDQDRWSHPARYLSRGVVTLAFLGRLGLGAIALEAMLSLMIGWKAFFFWLGTLCFSLLMRWEFGLGQWLEERMLLYAITHNPIVACLALFAWSCSGEAWQPRNLWYVLTVSLASFGFELARKTNRPEEEIEGVDSYTSVYGLKKVLWILRTTIVLSIGTASVVLFSLSSSIWGWGILGLASLLSLYLTLPSGTAKKFEGAGLLFLLLAMLSMIVAPW